MLYVIDCEQVISGSVHEVWDVWTDMAHFPDWDPREEELRLDGPFTVGVTGFSKQRGGRPGSAFSVTAVEPLKRWVNQVPLPGGRLTMDHLLDDLGDGKVRIVKRYTVEGPMAIAFRLFFAKSIRAEAPETFKALEQEVARRSELGLIPAASD